jgi:hypothetical protein
VGLVLGARCDEGLLTAFRRRSGRTGWHGEGEEGRTLAGVRGASYLMSM